MGMVHVTELLRDRVFRVFFGGTDSWIDYEEQIRMDAYLTRLAKKIWGLPSRWRALMVLLTFDDDDLQSLVLEEHEHLKKQGMKHAIQVQEEAHTIDILGI